MIDRQTNVSVVMTVKNDSAACTATIDSLIDQSRTPDELVVVDGGSTDGTIALIEAYASRFPWIKVVYADGANIARGRNIGIASISSGIIATIDAGCRAERVWLDRLVAPFEHDPTTELVGGFYRIDARSLLEQVVGLATMRGQLEPIDPATFNPSARSMAFTKALWERAGGFPEWVRFSEDTLFDHKVRRLGVRIEFAPEALVHWRPRRTLRSIARQFYRYGTGRGHTQIDGASFRYILRNVALLTVAAVVVVAFDTRFWPLPAALFAYFHVWTFRGQVSAIWRHTRRVGSVPLTFAVLWVVQGSHLVGYLVGSWQRVRQRDRYAGRMERYLSGSSGAVV